MPNAWPDVERNLDAVIFDFDGVLVESNDIKTEVFRTLFAHETDHLAAIVALHHRLGGVSRWKKFDQIYSDILRRPLTEEMRRNLGDRFAAEVVEQVVNCPMVSGAGEVLDELNGRIPLAVVSGTPDGELKDIVSRRGLTRFFVDVLGSPVEKADLISEFMAKHRLRAERTLMVGDAMTDYSAAHACNLGFIGRVRVGTASPFPPQTPCIADLSALESMVDTLYKNGNSSRNG